MSYPVEEAMGYVELLKATNAPGLGNRVSSCGRAVPSDSRNGEVKSAGPERERPTASAKFSPLVRPGDSDA
jgi:hypothetical protein